MNVKHRFKAEQSPGDVMEWMQTFLWDFVEEYNPTDPAEYDCWLKKDITVKLSIK